MVHHLFVHRVQRRQAVCDLVEDRLSLGVPVEQGIGPAESYPHFGMPFEHVGRQTGHPGGDRAGLSLAHQFHDALLHVVGGVLHVSGRQPVLRGVYEEAALLEPVGGQSVQRGHQFRIVPLEAALEELREEAVIAVPLPAFVETGDEQVGALEVQQDVAAVLEARHRVAERRREAVEDARAEQELLRIEVLARDGFLPEVVGEVGEVAGYGAEHVVLVLTVFQQQGGELKGGRPSLGVSLQPRQLRVVQAEGLVPAHELQGLLPAEAQVFGAHLEQVPLHAQPADAETGDAPRAQDDQLPGHELVEQARTVASTSWLWMSSKSSMKMAKGECRSVSVSRMLAGLRPLPGSSRGLRGTGIVEPTLLQVKRARDLDQAGEKPPDVVVGLVDGEPTHSAPAIGEALEELQHEGRLAPARGSVDERELGFERTHAPLIETASGNRRWEDGRSQFRQRHSLHTRAPCPVDTTTT